MYLVVVGAGRIGSSFIEMATSDGHDVVVIEKDDLHADEIADTYDCLVLNADATETSVLEEAGIERADAVISTTDDDAVNTMVMLLAQELDVESLISVVRDPGHIPVFEKIGVTLVENPHQLIAEHLYHSVKHPAVEDFMHLEGGSEFIEIKPSSGAPITRQPLAEAREAGTFPEGALVAAIVRDGNVLTPAGDTTLESGDLVTVLVNESSFEQVLEVFGHESNES